MGYTRSLTRIGNLRARQSTQTRHPCLSFDKLRENIILNLRQDNSRSLHVAVTIIELELVETNRARENNGNLDLLQCRVDESDINGKILINFLYQLLAKSWARALDVKDTTLLV